LAVLGVVVLAGGAFARATTRPASGSSTGRQSFAVARPGLTMSLRFAPHKLRSVRISADLRCEGGDSTRGILRVERVRHIRLDRRGRFLFHTGHAYSVWVLSGRIRGDRLVGRLRSSSKRTIHAERCGTLAPKGRWIRFIARRTR
jgi:hypothetical protein